MTNSYRIEKIGYGEVDKIAQLYSSAFARPMQANTFKWKYFDDFLGKSICLGVKDKQNLAGVLAIIPEEFYFLGKKNNAYKCVDLMINPLYRGGWLPVRLVSSISAYLKVTNSLFMYAICAKYVTPFFLKKKWIKLNDVEYYFKHRIQLKAKFLFNAYYEGLYRKGILKKINSISELCKYYKFNIDYSKIHIAKNEDYFQWRLRDPRYIYSIIGYYGDGELRGYIIYNAGIKNDIYIVDLEAYDNDEKVIRTLLSAVELMGCNSRCRSIITLAIKGNPFQLILKKNGYIKNPFNRGPLVSLLDFIILANDKYSDKLENKANWNIYPLNYDDI